jgi:hypothetical protein
MMKKKSVIQELVESVGKLNENIGSLEMSENEKLLGIISEMGKSLSDLTMEILRLNDEKQSNEMMISELASRLEDLEDYMDDYLEDSSFSVEEDIDAILCPHCGVEIHLEDEFLSSDEQKLTCTSCNKEILFEMDEGFEHGECGCGDSCDCEDEECDCGGNCDCS